MTCAIEFNDPSARITFNYREEKQPMLIDILLTYGQLDLADLASMLGISTVALHEAQQQTTFLYDKPASDLIQLFLIFISN